MLALQLSSPGLGALPTTPIYTSKEEVWMAAQAGVENSADDWHRDNEQYLILLQELGHHLLGNVHHTTHLGEIKMIVLLNSAKPRFCVRDRGFGS